MSPVTPPNYEGNIAKIVWPPKLRRSQKLGVYRENTHSNKAIFRQTTLYAGKGNFPDFIQNTVSMALSDYVSLRPVCTLLLVCLSLCYSALLSGSYPTNDCLKSCVPKDCFHGLPGNFI